MTNLPPATIRFDAAQRTCHVDLALPDVIRTVAPTHAQRLQDMLRNLPLDAHHLKTMVGFDFTEATVLDEDLGGDAEYAPIHTLNVQCHPGGFEITHDEHPVRIQVQIPLTDENQAALNQARSALRTGTHKRRRSA